MTRAEIPQQLETMYTKIHRERMHDMPMCHEVIGIHALGFEQWGDKYLGVMITPWFMNLMLLPVELTDWQDKKLLTEEVVTFPSGNYRFVVGEETDIGKYLSCSLFSIMHEFQDDQAAVETGHAVLEELMNDAHKQYSEFNETEIMERWQKQDEMKQQQKTDSIVNETNNTQSETDNTIVEENIITEEQKPQFSRRQLLGGGKKELDNHVRN